MRIFLAWTIWFAATIALAVTFGYCIANNDYVAVEVRQTFVILAAALACSGILIMALDLLGTIEGKAK